MSESLKDQFARYGVDYKWTPFAHTGAAFVIVNENEEKDTLTIKRITKEEAKARGITCASLDCEWESFNEDLEDGNE